MSTLRLRPRGTQGLKNVGPVSARWLSEVGIRKRADLIRLGPVEAFLRVKAAGHRPSLNLLWALAGAERGLQWSKLAAEDRQQLLLELDAAIALKDPAAKAPAAKGPVPKGAAAKGSIPKR
jgi:DNA transformation protein and related proteins